MELGIVVAGVGVLKMLLVVGIIVGGSAIVGVGVLRMLLVVGTIVGRGSIAGVGVILIDESEVV